MSEIAVHIDEILLDPWNRGLLWPTVFACFFVLLFLLWLFSRRIRLWYWKVNAQVSALNNIDQKLQQLEEGIKGNALLISGAETSGETEIAEGEVSEAPEVCETEDAARNSEPPADVYSVGKGGTI